MTISKFEKTVSYIDLRALEEKINFQPACLLDLLTHLRIHRFPFLVAFLFYFMHMIA